MEITKGASPFYPGRPVPVDFFSGRADEIERLRRSLHEVNLGKPAQAIFIQGEYGIGKSSLAGVARKMAEVEYNLFAVQVLLDGATTLDDMSQRVLEAFLNSEYHNPSTTERVRNRLSKYVGKQSLFGISLRFDELKKDAPALSSGFVPFLREVNKGHL